MFPTTCVEVVPVRPSTQAPLAVFFHRGLFFHWSRSVKITWRDVKSPLSPLLGEYIHIQCKNIGLLHFDLFFHRTRPVKITWGDVKSPLYFPTMGKELLFSLELRIFSAPVQWQRTQICCYTGHQCKNSFCTRCYYTGRENILVSSVTTLFLHWLRELSWL